MFFFKSRLTPPGMSNARRSFRAYDFISSLVIFIFSSESRILPVLNSDTVLWPINTGSMVAALSRNCPSGNIRMYSTAASRCLSVTSRYSSYNGLNCSMFDLSSKSCGLNPCFSNSHRANSNAQTANLRVCHAEY